MRLILLSAVAALALAACSPQAKNEAAAGDNTAGATAQGAAQAPVSAQFKQDSEKPNPAAADASIAKDEAQLANKNADIAEKAAKKTGVKAAADRAGDAAGAAASVAAAAANETSGR